MNNGNGNGDMDLGGGFGAQAGGAVGSGGQVSAEPDRPGADIPGGYGESPSPSPNPNLNEAMNLLQGAYPSTPSPAPAPASAPYSMDNLSKTFSPPEPAPEGGKAKGSTLGQIADKMAEWGIRTSGLGPYGLIGTLFGLFGKACIDTTAAFGLNEGKGYTPGQLIDLGFGALGVKEGLGKTEGKAEAPSVSAPSARGAPITGTAKGYSEKTSEPSLESVLSFTPIQKAPSSYPSYYGGSAYPALSMSLFQAKENGGLMIFPTSGGAIEPEMSSLVKKQEPVIDTPSIFFLMGMGLLGAVLRGKK